MDNKIKQTENPKLKKIRHFHGNLEDFKTFWEEQIKKQKENKSP